MATYKQITEYVKVKYNYTPKPCWIADVKKQMGFNVPYAHNRKDKKARKHPCPKDKIEDIKEAIMQGVKSKAQSSVVSEARQTVNTKNCANMINKGKVKYTGIKYLPLKEYLKTLNKDRVILSHKEIESILNDNLPKSAYKYEEFWGNNRANNQEADHSNSWLEVGWEVEKVDLENEVIRFKTKEQICTVKSVDIK